MPASHSGTALGCYGNSTPMSVSISTSMSMSRDPPPPVPPVRKESMVSDSVFRSLSSLGCEVVDIGTNAFSTPYANAIVNTDADTSTSTTTNVIASQTYKVVPKPPSTHQSPACRPVDLPVAFNGKQRLLVSALHRRSRSNVFYKPVGSVETIRDQNTKTPDQTAPQPQPEKVAIVPTQLDDAANRSKPAKVIDPHGRIDYWWSFVVSVAWLYNFWIIIFRTAFLDPTLDAPLLWIVPDYTADLIYVIDIMFQFWTGFLEDGVLVRDPVKLRQHYLHSKLFYVDCLAVAPVDILYLRLGFVPPVRFLRLLKTQRFFNFVDRTERHTNSPNAIRTMKLALHLFAIVHWNACICHLVASCSRAFAEKDYIWSPASNHLCVKEPRNISDTLDMVQTPYDVYLHALYWSTLFIIGEHPQPITTEAYLFVAAEVLLSLILFATVVGYVTQIVASISVDRKEFQGRLDAVKIYMRLRRVPKALQDRVIKWFDYLWICKRTADEEKVLSLLPQKLRADIAIHVHLETLKSVDFFQNSEDGFLAELVLKLRPVLFSPGDYICKKNEIGKEMYIITKGKLHVLADDGVTVLAVLTAGKYFGEISILNAAVNNRRTATVRSVGYSDLFCLSKDNLWDVLRDYPAERARLETIAAKRMAQFRAHNQQVLRASRESIDAANTTVSGGRKPTRSSASSIKPPSIVGEHSAPNRARKYQAGHNPVDANLQSQSTSEQLQMAEELERLDFRLQNLEKTNAALVMKLHNQEFSFLRRLQELESRMHREFSGRIAHLGEEPASPDNTARLLRISNQSPLSFEQDLDACSSRV